jgi:hypothetical protein
MIGEILEVQADDGQITSARYLFTETDAQNTVQTEGNWFFEKSEDTTPFDQVTEQMIVGWIVDATTINGVNAIKSQLDAQLSSLKAAKTVNLPWNPPIFTVEL